MRRNVLCIGYVIAHWEELDNKHCVENKGWTWYPSCTLKELRGDTLNLTHPLLYWQQITWASVMTMKSGHTTVKIRSISSGSWCCVTGCVDLVLFPWPLTMKSLTTFLWSIRNYTPSDSIILKDLYVGTVGLYGETTIVPHTYIRGSYRKSWATFFCMRTGNSRRRRVRW